MIGAPQAGCEKCGTDIPYNAERCIGCGTDVGFHNVRAANQIAEVEALRERVRYAQVASGERDCRSELEAFGTAAADSAAVMRLQKRLRRGTDW